MIRQDFLNELTSHSRQQQAEAKMDLTLGLLQEQFDQDMAGWVQSGGQSAAETHVHKNLIMLRRESQKSFWGNPHGRVAIRTTVKFTIGGGCIVDFHEKEKNALKMLRKWWKKCAKSVKWFSFIREYVTRAARDGEVFVRKYSAAADMPIILRFVDPDRISDDGIKTGSDVEAVISYQIEGEDTPVPASDMHHFKGFNADRNMKRGRPNLEVILPTLAKYGKWLDARLTLSLVRNSVAIVKQVNGTGQDLLRLRAAQTATRTKPNETNKAKMLQPGTILQGTPGVEYKMLSTNLDARDAAEDGRTFLLAAAAGVGLPDVFMTADYANANFASTVVAQNPAVREFEETQQILTEEFTEIVDWYLQDGLEKGQFPAMVNDGEDREIDLDFDIVFPPILRADTAKENDVCMTMNQAGAMSRRTWQLRMNLDPDQEDQYIQDEGGPVVQKQPAGATPPDTSPTRVQDRSPRQNVKVGESDTKKIAQLAVVIKKKGNKHDKSLDVEYQMLRQEPEVEVGGNWPDEHAS